MKKTVLIAIVLSFFCFLNLAWGFAFLSIIAFKEDFEDFWNSKIRKISLGDTVQDF
jgi:hypothetical protein